MRLVVVSYKECWAGPASPTGYATVGGFPFQMEALSELFDATTLLLPLERTPLPVGARSLVGKDLRVVPLERPPGTGWRRKLVLLGWMPRALPGLWREIRRADAVHTPVPGDIGVVGLLVALVLGKPLFVRHCGTWGNRATLADRFLAWLLPRIAGGKRVVLATGGADDPPSWRNPNVEWIFSTTLTEDEWQRLPLSGPWRRGDPLRLVTVGRLSPGKNVEAAVRALPLIRQTYPQTTLDIIGDGRDRPRIEQIVADLKLDGAVTLHGNISHEDVLKALAAAHLFVFPTRVAEGFPKAVLEGMASGLPVIAPPVSVLPHLLRDGGGWLLRDTDHASLAEAVLEAIADDERLARMAASARATSRAYTLERWRDEIGARLEASWGALQG